MLFHLSCTNYNSRNTFKKTSSKQQHWEKRKYLLFRCCLCNQERRIVGGFFGFCFVFFLKDCYVECINICKCVWCVMKSATDLVTQYLANNLIAGNCSFTQKCIKTHCRKNYNPRYFPHRTVTKQQYFGIMFDFLIIFPGSAKESWQDFLKAAKKKKKETTIIFLCLMFVVS